MLASLVWEWHYRPVVVIGQTKDEYTADEKLAISLSDQVATTVVIKNVYTPAADDDGTPRRSNVYIHIYIHKYLFINIYTPKSGVVDVFTLDKLKLSLIKRLKTGGSDGGLGDKCKQSKRDTRVCHEENTINDAAAADSREYCIIYIFLNLFLHPSRRKKQNKKTL